MILAGDIGGTKSLLAYFSPQDEPRQPHYETSLPSRNYLGLTEVLKDFLAKNPAPVEFACFGVPGPVAEGRCETPNLPWVVDARDLRRVTHSEVVLINDLEATAYGIAALRPQELFALSEGKPAPQGNAALIAPGTGLGEAMLFWDGEQHRPAASEGGHTSFAAQNALEMNFLRYLLKEFDHVSYDRVVTGSGLRRLYDFLKETGYAEEPSWLREELASAEDPAAVISRAALEKRSELCVKALDMWVSIFGAEAGNLALKALATAGVFLGGGIAPKILPKLKDGTFLTAFQHKGRLSSVVGQIPVRVILNDKTALYGTAGYALEQHKGK
ncbi:MAG: glucokinase [Terriglobia bacterium]